MGVRFNLDQANLVGWLTCRDFRPSMRALEWYLDLRRRRHLTLDECKVSEDREWRAPRIKIHVLRDFLEALPNSVVTSHPEDHEFLCDLVDKSRETFQSTEERDAEAVVSSTDVARILAPLRCWFDVPFYFMPLGHQVSFGRFRDSTNYTMWLQCEDDRPASVSRDLLDPFFPLRQLFTSKTYVPATVCWTWSGETVVIPQETAPIEKLLEMIRNIPPWQLWSELKRLPQFEAPAFNILQLSDLHFGATAVTNRKLAYVEQHLRDRIDQVHKTGGIVQPVITGDLMDTPSKENLEKFEAFRNRLTDYSKTNVICIPGNHDMRKKGFLWKNWEVLAGLEWQSVISSDVCKVVFICFDTSRDAKLAQGSIEDDQFLEVATKLTELRRRKNCSDYIYVALAHHHPFSTSDDEIDTLPFLGIREERFVRMENGDHLVRWCGSNGVPLILHGHKHRPRFIGKEIEIEGSTRLVRAVGCGSSFGIENKPLSFNWITWQPTTKQWAVSFFADPGDGSGFQEKRLAIGAQPDV
jgi:predicted phosphodiesterase